MRNTVSPLPPGGSAPSKGSSGASSGASSWPERATSACSATSSAPAFAPSADGAPLPGEGELTAEGAQERRLRRYHVLLLLLLL